LFCRISEENPPLTPLAENSDTLVRKINVGQADLNEFAYPATCGVEKFEDSSVARIASRFNQFSDVRFR
jgi:hypothetical protein